MNETFTERLKRLIYSCTVKQDNFYYMISFPTEHEAHRYRAMYPNKKMTIHSSYFYENADEALAPQKLKVITE